MATKLPKRSAERTSRPRDLSGRLLRQGEAPRGADGHYISWAEFRPVDGAGRSIPVGKLPKWVQERRKEALADARAAAKVAEARKKAAAKKAAAKKRAEAAEAKRRAAEAKQKAKEARERAARREGRLPRDPSGAILRPGVEPRAADGQVLTWDAFRPVDVAGAAIPISSLPAWMLTERSKAQALARRRALEEAERARKERLATEREARRERERQQEIEREIAREKREQAAAAKRIADAIAAEAERVATSIEADKKRFGKEIVTAGEMLDAILIESRAKAIELEKIEKWKSDATLVRNPQTGSLGMQVAFGGTLDQGAIADIKAIVADAAADIASVMRSDRVKIWVSIQLTEFGKNLIGSPTSVIMETDDGILSQTWQGVKGGKPSNIANRTGKLLEKLVAEAPRNAAVVEGVIIRGYILKEDEKK